MPSMPVQDHAPAEPANGASGDVEGGGGAGTEEAGLAGTGTEEAGSSCDEQPRGEVLAASATARRSENCGREGELGEPM
jgi:hypothetical protein